MDINPDNPVSEIESLCVQCEDNGTTRILLTKIPFFKEVIIMSFTCYSCGYRSSEVQPGQSLSDHGIHFDLNITSSRDLNRQVIKSEYATIKVPSCDLEIPPNTQKGKLTTIEGFLTTTRDQFKESLETGFYNQIGEEVLEKIKGVINRIDDVLLLKSLPTNFILDDPSGNSFIENPYAPQTDLNIKVSYYERTKEMAESMGYMIQPNEENKLPTSTIENKEGEQSKPKEFVNPSYYDKKKDFTVYKSQSEISAHLIDFTKSIEDNKGNVMEEALVFQTSCYCCNIPGELYMCTCTIPYFKEIIISCFKCQNCGYKTSEVKGGGGISEKAGRITLSVKSKDDLNRDVFKSETAKIIIPEVEFETDTGSMGSMYTTVEGVIDKLIKSLEDIPFSSGDSCGNKELDTFIEKLTHLRSGETSFTLIIDDCLNNSFIFSPGDPKDDKHLIKEEYERTWEQNEELGLNDMNVDNYC